MKQRIGEKKDHLRRNIGKDFIDDYSYIQTIENEEKVYIYGFCLPNIIYISVKISIKSLRNIYYIYFCLSLQISTISISTISFIMH